MNHRLNSQHVMGAYKPIILRTISSMSCNSLFRLGALSTTQRYIFTNRLKPVGFSICYKAACRKAMSYKFINISDVNNAYIKVYLVGIVKNFEYTIRSSQ